MSNIRIRICPPWGSVGCQENVSFQDVGKHPLERSLCSSMGPAAVTRRRELQGPWRVQSESLGLCPVTGWLISAGAVRAPALFEHFQGLCLTATADVTSRENLSPQKPDFLSFCRTAFIVKDHCQRNSVSVPQGTITRVSGYQPHIDCWWGPVSREHSSDFSRCSERARAPNKRKFSSLRQLWHLQNITWVTLTGQTLHRVLDRRYPNSCRYCFFFFKPYFLE